MHRVTVVKVNGLRTPEQRAGVVYCGRGFAGWPASRWANPFRPRPGGPVGTCLGEFREYAMSQSPAWWADLWAATDSGRLPLGCYCYAGPAEAGVGVCHAAILGAELNRRFADGGMS